MRFMIYLRCIRMEFTYLKDRWICFLSLCFFFSFTWIAQVCGIEYLNEKFFTRLVDFPYLRFFIWVVISLLFNSLLYKKLFIYIYRQQKEAIEIIKKFLEIKIGESFLAYFYILQFTLAMLINESRIFIWATPQEYMKMHTAAAILARRYYYSFYNTPELIWNILRGSGGREYSDQVKNINLVKGIRYVARDNEKKDIYAFTDFNNITNLSINYVKAEEVNKIPVIPDFSTFDVGEKFINLRILEYDTINMENLFKKLIEQGMGTPEDTRRQLNKIRFRVHIEIASPSSVKPEVPTTDWVQNALDRLGRITQDNTYTQS